MSLLLDVFLQDLKKTGLFEEWTKHVKAKEGAEALAQFILESMRDTTDDQKRRAFVAFATFMRGRPWQEALADLEKAFTQQEVQDLQAPNSEQFYLRLRIMVLSQIDDYFREFLASQEEKTDEIRAVLASDAFEEIDTRIVSAVRMVVADQMRIFKGQLMKELDKRLDEGDEWKGGGKGQQPE